MEDAARKRRKYMREVASARAMLTLGVTIIALCALFVNLVLCNETRVDSAINLRDELIRFFGVVSVLIGLGAIGACGILLGLGSLTRLYSIPYVAPVHEQIAALPADEILLRGAKQPPAALEALLKAAREVPVTGAVQEMANSNETESWSLS